MRILVVKTHAFGDSLLATAAVSALIDSGNSVSVLSGPSSVDVWNRLPGIELVIQSPVPCSFLKLFWWSLRNKLTGFDKVIHIGSSKKVYYWLRLLTGSDVISGGDGKTGFGLARPAALDYCRIAGVSNANLRPVFPLTHIEISTAEKFTGSSSYIVLAPGGARNARDFVPLKRWPMSSWQKVSLALQARGYKVILIGGPSDRNEISSVTGLNLAGKLSWGETAAVISKATMFAGNDSGPAHLAVATAVPVLVLFGPTDPEALYEKGSIVPVCGTVSCSPCYSNSIFPGCKGDEDCMTSIDTEMVIDTLEGMLHK